MKKSKDINGVDNTPINGRIYPTQQFDVMRFQSIVPWKTIFRSSRPGYPRTVVPKHSLKTAITEIWKMGISTVVDLLSDAESYKYYGLDLCRFYRRTAKLHVIRCPVSDFGIPRVSFMLNCCLKIAGRHAEGQSVLIHCSAGIGRTALALNCYAIYREVVYGEAPITFDGCEVAEQYTFLQLFRAQVKQYAKHRGIVCSKQQSSKHRHTTKKMPKV